MTTETISPNSPKEEVQKPFSQAVFYSCWFVGLFLDQATKLGIIHLSGFEKGFYPPYSGVEIIPDFFNIVYTVNEGAAWGMLQGKGWLFITLAVLATGFIFFWRHSLGIEKRINQWALGLMLGGIFGNTIDRIAYGHVVDFLDFHLWLYRWPTFNIADSMIVIGTGLYMIDQFFFQPKEEALKNS